MVQVVVLELGALAQQFGVLLRDVLAVRRSVVDFGDFGFAVLQTRLPVFVEPGSSVFVSPLHVFVLGGLGGLGRPVEHEFCTRRRLEVDELVLDNLDDFVALLLAFGAFLLVRLPLSAPRQNLFGPLDSPRRLLGSGPSVVAVHGLGLEVGFGDGLELLHVFLVFRRDVVGHFQFSNRSVPAYQVVDDAGRPHLRTHFSVEGDCVASSRLVGLGSRCVGDARVSLPDAPRRVEEFVERSIHFVLEQLQVVRSLEHLVVGEVVRVGLSGRGPGVLLLIRSQTKPTFEVLHESPLGVREWNCSYSEIADIVSSMLVETSLVSGFRCLPALKDFTIGLIFSKRLRWTFFLSS